MGFELTDAHIAEYHQLGYTVFRSIIPTALLGDLRREADKGRAIAHAGAISQRIQPITKHPQLATRPFEDFLALPALGTAMDRLFERDFGRPVDMAQLLTQLGVLYEPAAGGAWCTSWHRDWRDNIRGLRLAEWDKRMLDVRFFNQFNAPLYDDSSTWVVPGSHLRRDLPREASLFPDRPIPAPDLTGLNSEQCEATCREYTMRMPGAVQAQLNAGDFMLYRNCLWHIGNYVWYRKRATLHSAVLSPAYAELCANVPFHPRGANGEPAGWENPNRQEAALASAR